MNIIINDKTRVAIESEREYQLRKWPRHTHTVGEYLLIMEKCLQDAKRRWRENDENCLDEIRQVVTVGLVAMDEHGAPKRVPSAIPFQECESWKSAGQPAQEFNPMPQPCCPSQPWNTEQRRQALVVAMNVAKEKAADPGNPPWVAEACDSLIKSCDAILGMMSVPSETIK